MSLISNEKFIMCSCHGEGVLLQNFPNEDLLYMSMFYIGKSYKLSWIERIKYVLKVLWTGERFADQLVLSKQETADLVDHLIKVQNKE